MNILINLLLLSCLLVASNGNTGRIEQIEEGILNYFRESREKKEPNLTGSEEHKLELAKLPELGRSAHSVVWKGIYNGKKDVAVKIFADEMLMQNEVKIYKALNAIDDEKIENRHIPRIYYYGKFQNNLFSIAMSLFDGSLADYYFKPRDKVLSHLDIIYIFLQAIKGLEYLTKMNVVHNDIKPQNLFYRGEDVFLGDFDLAAVNGKQHRGHTLQFASRNFFANKSRTAMDDLESLIYSIAFLARVPLDPAKNHEKFPEVFPEGYVMFENLKKGKSFAKSKIMKKFNKYLTYVRIRDVFETLIDEILSDAKIPRYSRIYDTLQDAIILINQDRRFGKSEWMSEGLCETLIKLATLCEK